MDKVKKGPRLEKKKKKKRASPTVIVNQKTQSRQMKAEKTHKRSCFSLLKETSGQVVEEKPEDISESSLKASLFWECLRQGKLE